MRFAYLNFHSNFALELTRSLTKSGSQLCACTVDCLHRNTKLDQFLNQYSCPVVLDTTHAWQNPDISLDLIAESSPAHQFLDLPAVRNSLITWFLHRENYGMGLSEELLNFFLSTTISNACSFLASTQPRFIFSTFAPCTPFDIAISILCPSYNCSYLFLNDLPLLGKYFLTSSVDSHFEPFLVPNISPASGHVFACNAVVEAYLSSIASSSPYYMPVDVIEPNISIRDSSFKLQRIIDSIPQSLAEDTVPNGMGLGSLFTSKLLKSFSFNSSRDMKHDIPFQHNKELSRASYLSSMKERLADPSSLSPYILILLDYYPEITRVPIGGSNYHWFNYFLIAFRLCHIFKASNLEPTIFVKEHPAMLAPRSHSYVRSTLIQYMDHYGIKFASPFSKLTDLLVSSPPLCVIAGVSNAAVECSALSIPVVTPSNPWWLSLPNTFHVNPHLPINLSSNIQGESLSESFSKFLCDFSYDLSHPMHSLDTSFSKFSDSQIDTINAIANSIYSYLD